MFTIFVRKAHHNIYPSSDLLLTSWRPILSVFNVVWNFLIKYQDDYLWWNIKYFSPGQRAISSKRHNSPFFGLRKPRWLFIFVMQSDPCSHCSSRSVLPPYSLRSLIATLNPTFQNWKFGTFFLLNLSDSEILTKVLHSSTNKTHKKTCPLSYLNVEPFIEVPRSTPLTLSRNNKPLTPSSYKKVMI